ncbi:MAG TPA: succinate dehydrogenase cytochrome b subunit [Bacteroidia bacterium]|jgi:succinate dehydrogenase / fumarate reductase cytochrome b subunit|nr:succinate dehydrogenase cytochrome b subunit [Bacteroidia bacterium]
MTTIKQYLLSSIGKKVVMASTGLFLCVFLLEHIYGNILLYAGDDGSAFNEYSHSASHNIIIRIIEFVLFGSIIAHVFQAIVITKDNAKARPIKYAVSTSTEGSSWFSRNMGITGSIIFFFIVIHLYNFFLPYRITEMPNGATLAVITKAAFQNPIYVCIYCVGVTFLFFHLLHGFRSSFHTLGLNNKKYTPLWKAIGTGFALLMWIGFISFPILFYFNLAGNNIPNL